MLLRLLCILTGTPLVTETIDRMLNRAQTRRRWRHLHNSDLPHRHSNLLVLLHNQRVCAPLILPCSEGGHNLLICLNAPHYRHNRLSLFSSLFSLTWFLTAHILIYTSLKTCRFSSPHIWYLVFGILCITYLMILEVILLSLVVFVFAPGMPFHFHSL